MEEHEPHHHGIVRPWLEAARLRFPGMDARVRHARGRHHLGGRRLRDGVALHPINEPPRAHQTREINDDRPRTAPNVRDAGLGTPLPAPPPATVHPVSFLAGT